MNWLDLAIAQPTVGIVCEPRLQFPHEMLEALHPALAAWKTRHPNLVFYIPAPNALIQIKLGDGFSCEVLGNGFTTTFAYESRIVDRPASLPTIANPSIVRFSELLSRASDLTATLCDKLCEPPVVLKRLGIVADCRIDEKALPPGIGRFLDHVGSPWGERPLVLSGTVSAELPKSEKWTFRCHHTIDINSLDRPEDVRVKLDWQMFPIGDPVPVTRGTARRLIDDACALANKYFEKFGGGGLSYAAPQS